MYIYENFIKINIGVIKGVIKVLINSHFMFHQTTYISKVFNVNYLIETYSQQSTVLGRATAAIASFASEQRYPRSIHICSRATPEVQEVNISHDETVADFNSRLLMIMMTCLFRICTSFGKSNP